jgi:hypothetical protein
MTPDEARELSESWTIHLEAERKSSHTIRGYTDGLRLYVEWCEDNGRKVDLEGGGQPNGGTSMTTPKPGRTYLSPDIIRVQDAIDGLIARIATRDGVAMGLEDHELLALDRWTEGANKDLQAECRSRAEQQQMFKDYREKNE